MSLNSDVVIVAAYRTPIGNLNGVFSHLKASDLGTTVLKHILEETHVLPDEIVIGQALTAGQGQNPARQTAINSGCPDSVIATTINMLCGSGLKACVYGYQAIKNGDAKIVVCGGQESMSQAPHCLHIRNGHKLNDVSMIDSMMHDGLTDVFNKCPMGKTADHVAKVYGISREDQDKFALESQKKYQNAYENNAFVNEIVPVKILDRKVEKFILKDEFPRENTSLEALGKLKPYFVPLNEGGTVTPGNSSGINDGAALLMLTSLEEANNRNLKPLVRIVSWAQHGNEPMLMGVAPIEAIKKAVSKANWNLDQIDLFEINEAFSSQSLAILRELKLDDNKVNINGGSIALGHPIGCSGARVLVTLIHSLIRLNKKRGLAALCVGGGMSIAMCVETL
ncbi:unnamed protein product [Brachionus calyciflorus]|uniref:Uncharacterized protein n=1 Tax=Brachionus calyciflorus TaxID=104777 RepID=A0A813TIJ4_9BILA|nr:unnamed protein product [Brachionus calyciflorus]